MCSSTTRLPSFATCTEIAACGSENDLASAVPAIASAATAAARRETLAGRRRRRIAGGGSCRGDRRCRSGGLEADRRHLAVAGVLDLEELATREAERARDQDGGENLDRVVERQDRVVVDLSGDGDLVLG